MTTNKNNDLQQSFGLSSLTATKRLLTYSRLTTEPDAKIISKFIAQGADVNATGTDGKTALDIFAERFSDKAITINARFAKNDPDHTSDDAYGTQLLGKFADAAAKLATAGADTVTAAATLHKTRDILSPVTPAAQKCTDFINKIG